MASCSSCNGSGRGYGSCYKCNGSGRTDDGHWSCPHCNGTGKEKCSACGGSGNVADSSSSYSGSSSSGSGGGGRSGKSPAHIKADQDFSEGLRLHQQGDYQGAIAAYNRALTFFSSSGVVYASRGGSYGRIGEYNNAIADYTKAISLETKQQDLALRYLSRGTVYCMDTNDYDKAIADFSQAIKLGYEPGSAYFWRSLAYKKKGDRKNETADLLKAAENGETDAAERLNAIAVEYINSGSKHLEEEVYDKAIADFNDAIKLGSDNVVLSNAYFRRGLCYVKTDKKDLATADLKMAADYGLENALEVLKDWGIDYTPTPRTREIKADKQSKAAEQGDAKVLKNPKGNFILAAIFGVVSAVQFGTLAQWISKSMLPSFFEGVGDTFAGTQSIVYAGVWFVAIILGFIFMFKAWRNKRWKSIILLFIISIAGFYVGRTQPAFPLSTAVTATTATVTSDSLNFRDAPGTNSNVIKTLKKGDTLTVTGDTANGWVPVKHDNDTGWVSGDLIEVKK